jgi:hypothetical protein
MQTEKVPKRKPTTATKSLSVIRRDGSKAGYVRHDRCDTSLKLDTVTRNERKTGNK